MVLRDCVWLTDKHTLPFSPTHLYVHSEQRPHKEQTMPGQFVFAWTELKPCLHTIEGCFKGVETDKDTQMGEFHALMTLDSGEVRRAIIPQAIVHYS
jgi:hypothetical protein